MTESMNNRVYVKALEKATAALENGHGRSFPATQCRHFLKRLLQSDSPIIGKFTDADRQDLAAFFVLQAPACGNEYVEGCQPSAPGTQYAWDKINASTSVESGDCRDAETDVGRNDRG